MPAPVYLSQGNVQGLEAQPESRINAGALTERAAQNFGQAAGGLGQSMLQLSGAIAHVNRAVGLADRQTNFLTGIDKLQQDFQNDQDPATAQQRFQERAATLEAEALKGLPAEDTAELGLKIRRQTISYAGAVRGDALKKQADTFSAGLDKQYEAFTRRYAQAGSDDERNAIAAELDDTLGKGIKDGMITAKSAEAYRQSLRKTGGSAVVLRQIASNPAAAQSALADPAQYAGLDPVQREQLTAQARAAAEEARRAALEREAAYSPATAALKAGMVVRPEHAAAIFDRIVQQESGGNPNAQSGKGAAGIAQIMPDTARMLVKQTGIADWSGDSDAQVRQFLKEDPALSKKLGLKYFSDLLAKFNWQLAPAIAAYHAGPGGLVGKAHSAALAKYGDGYSAQQFLEFLPASLTDGDKATADYVRDIYKRMGVDISQPGPSGVAAFRASNTVGAEIERQRAEADRILNGQVNVAGQAAGEIIPMLNNGAVVDAQRLVGIQAPLELAAARGDANAAKKLGELYEAMANQPLVQKAYGMRPEELALATAQMEQQLAIGGDATPAKARQLKVFKAVLGEMSTARKENPIALAERQGMPVTPLNLQAAPNSPELASQIGARAVVSNLAQTAYGGEHQFFRPEERIAIKARYEGMGNDERFQLLQSLAQNTSNEATYRAAVREITSGDKLATTAGMFMKTNPGLARDIFRGAELMQLDGVKPKAEEIKQAMRGTFPTSAYPPAVTADLVDAITAIYVAKRGKNAALHDPSDKSGLQEAAERVVGPMVSINGGQVPLPNGITKAEASDLMWRLDNKTLEAFGGAHSQSGRQLDAYFVGRHARLVPLSVGGDRYQVVLPQGEVNRAIRTNTGADLIIDLPKAVAMQRVRNAPTPAAARSSTIANMYVRPEDASRLRQQQGVTADGQTIIPEGM